MFMTHEIATILSSLLGAAIIAFAKPLVDFYRERKQAQLAESEQEHKYELSSNEQLFQSYRALIDTLIQNVSKLSDDIRAMEKAHLVCKEENANLRAEVTALKDKLEALTTELQLHKEVTSTKANS